jgi:protein-tyrosine phosphatase
LAFLAGTAGSILAIDVLLLCTGNVCRSPMAEGLLKHRLAGTDVRVRSAGLLDSGRPASDHGIAILRDRGIDISPHRSEQVTAELVASSDLVLCMAREHAKVVVDAPDAWPRTFLFKEIVQRAEERGGRAAGEAFDEWLSKIHAGRSPRDLMAATGLDVDDPYGGSRKQYERTAAELEDLVDRLVQLAWPEASGEAVE